MSDQPAIEVAGLRKAYRKVRALDGVDLAVPTGSVLGLLGPNGAGKTTVVRILATLLAPDGGTARVDGYDVVGQAPQVRLRIGLTGQYAAVDRFATGRENLEQAGRLHRLGRARSARRAAELLDLLDLVEAADRRVETYSGGMRRRLDLATSLVSRPSVLFLDEPTTGLDPRARLAVWDVTRELAAGGTTVLLTTQYLDEADYLSARIALLDRGRVVAEGTPSELKARLGGARLTIRPVDVADGQRVAAAITEWSRGAPRIDQTNGEVVVAVDPDPGALADALHRVAALDLPVADVEVGRPALDDVFFSLTGPAGSGYASGGAA
ncbi:MAG: ATP-binding cassette domain-containing protein [Micromonosporaceae bacterium]|nr:ATP-binding cassette domain-containing protein [Micromonosporaceae bacterium]